MVCVVSCNMWWLVLGVLCDSRVVRLLVLVVRVGVCVSVGVLVEVVSRLNVVSWYRWDVVMGIMRGFSCF